MAKLKAFLVWTCILLSLGGGKLAAQASYKAIGLQGGLTVGTQKWNSLERDPLYGYHLAFLSESVQANRAGFFLQLGYHLKGSAVRTQFYSLSGDLERVTLKMKFHNVALAVGAKVRRDLNTQTAGYYMVGARLEYTVADSLALFDNLSNFINKVNYGITVGGGLERSIGKSNECFIELRIEPDFSQQLYMPPGYYYNRYTLQNQQVNEEKVVNLSLELSVGFKFLRTSGQVYE